ncbi:uroporphyrinogen decarboxylase family protein [Kiritimatiella glycovorans]|uniref:Uroporphyrinogen decarboxylase n=1 Tax=Kiritimatiella glycovorans TaxID=1307763 RepID=A0A0G3EGJ6_9BACT|nr:uroporphyrinogen decarboxylase family protein [Kiritimatiella glycovorans]AKJ64537.1 Uroporphyrinogen decarboxylase [Kiritimatiella glycovorans]
MTGKERTDAMLEGEVCDFVPRTPILMQYAAEYIGSDYGAFASDHRVLVEANLRCAEDFGMDQVSAISDPYREAAGFGGQIEFVRDGVPRCTPPMAERRDFSLLKDPDPEQSDRMRDRLDAVRLFKSKCAGVYSILGWIEGPAAEAADLRGTSNLMMDFYDDEVFAAELMDRCLKAAVDFARVQVEAGADMIGVGDAVASQISPDLYERLVQPREKRLVEAIHGFGARVKLHICGEITHLLPGIADLHIDVLDVDHMVDMKAVRDAVGGRTVLAGNIDPAQGVARGSTQAIRDHVRRTYEQVGNPYFVNAGCEIPAGTPEANLRALCEPLEYVKRMT